MTDFSNHLHSPSKKSSRLSRSIDIVFHGRRILILPNKKIGRCTKCGKLIQPKKTILRAYKTMVFLTWLLLQVLIFVNRRGFSVFDLLFYLGIAVALFYGIAIFCFLFDWVEIDKHQLDPELINELRMAQGGSTVVDTACMITQSANRKSREK